MDDHVRPCNSKPQQRDLTPVLHRPVELAANSGQTHRSKQHLYPITSSAMESSPSGASLQSFSAALARVNRRTHAWIRLRAAALQRDGYTCAVPGWGNATHVDHVVSRRSGGLDNLRSQCAVHDGQINEDNNGKRKSDGKPYLQNQNMF